MKGLLNDSKLPTQKRKNLDSYRVKLHNKYAGPLEILWGKRNPEHFRVFQAAAHKGKVISNVQTALLKLLQTKSVLEPYKDDSTYVFLFPELKVVLKKHPKKTREEVNLYQQLLCFDMPQGRVPSMMFQKLCPERYGIPILNTRDLKRAHDYSLLSRTFDPKKCSFHRISQIDGNKLLEEFSYHVKKKTKGPRSHTFLNRFKNQQFQLHHNERLQTLNFQELQGLYLRGKIDSSDLIGTEDAMSNTREPPSLEHHIRTQSLIGRTLTYTEQKPTLSCLLIPIPDTTHCEEYEKLEQSCIELFQGLSLSPEKSSIKDLQARRYTARLPMDSKIRIEGEKNSRVESLAHIQNKNILSTVTTPCKIFTSEPFFKRFDRAIQILRRVEAYEHIDNMILFHKAKETPIFFRNVFLNLTEDSAFFSVLGAELQHLDLHDNNIGIRLAKNPIVDHLHTFKFYFVEANATLCLEELMPIAREKRICSLHMKSPNGKTRKANAKELEDIHSLAQSGKWEFVVIDEGMMLQESSHWQFETLKDDQSTKTGHLIPFRSILYASPYKNIPFSEDVLERLHARLDNTQEVFDWVFRKDAPIHQYLDKNAVDTLHSYIINFLQNDVFSISYWNRTLNEEKDEDEDENEISTKKTVYPNHTLQFIRHFFCKTISQLPVHAEFWNLLQNSLECKNYFRPHRVSYGDTWRSISALYGISEKELQQMNPDVAMLSLNISITVHPKVSENTKESKKARKKIAAMLFPRMSYRQQKAYFERRLAQKQYLDTYKKLIEMDECGRDLALFLADVLDLAAAPLSTLERTNLSARLTAILDDDTALIEFKKELEKKLCPTYSNIVKCMYPNIADVTELTTIAVKHCKEFSSYNTFTYMPETLIGLYSYPIEDIIKAVKVRFPKGPERNLADHVEYTLHRERNDPLKTSYFGSWKMDENL